MFGKLMQELQGDLYVWLHNRWGEACPGNLRYDAAGSVTAGKVMSGLVMFVVEDSGLFRQDALGTVLYG